jgi:hypothetical protein
LPVRQNAVVHPLAPSKVRAGKSHAVLSSARHAEAGKMKDYAHMVALRHYQMHPFVMETCGGMGPAARRFVEIMAEEGEEHLHIWAKKDIIKELLHSVAIAVQRGSAVAVLHGYEQALCTLRSAAPAKAARDGALARRKREAMTAEESEEDAASAA